MRVSIAKSQELVMPADQTDELLEVCSEENQVIGLERRSVVHSKA